MFYGIELLIKFAIKLAIFIILIFLFRIVAGDVYDQVLSHATYTTNYAVTYIFDYETAKLLYAYITIIFTFKVLKWSLV